MVALARTEAWDRALPRLRGLIGTHGLEGDLPGDVFAYCGYGVARFERKLEEGLKLCTHAVRAAPSDSHGFYNLARVHLLRGDRRRAVKALKQGAALNPGHRALRELQMGIGTRARPVLKFLSRDNVLNVWLGRARARFRRAGQESADRAIW